MITKYYEPAEKVGNHRENLFSLKSLVEKLDPSSWDQKLSCHEENNQGTDCESCYMEGYCSIWSRLSSVFTEPYIACMCSRSDRGHRDSCNLGEAGKKLRRQIEDRLRKDPLLMLWISRIIGLSE